MASIHISPAAAAVKQIAEPRATLGDVGADAAAALISAAADIAVVVDGKGIVLDVSFGSEELLHEGCQEWIGRRFLETVTPESRVKVDEMLADAASRAASRGRQVNHPSPKGPDLPVRYSAVTLAGESRIVFLGRDLRAMAALQQRLAGAQQAMERDFERLRAAETRYRLLFQRASEAVIIVDVSSEKVSEVNPAALKLLALPIKRVQGRGFADLFDASSAIGVQSMLGTVRVAGQIADVRVNLADQRTELLLTASLFRQENASFCLVRLAPTSADAGLAKPRADILRVLDLLPEGFVVTDGNRRIVSANAAFLDLAQLATEEQARAEDLGRWLGREGVDMDVLASSLKEHGAVRHFPTIIRGEYGSIEEVEIAAVSVPNTEPPCLGFAIRSNALRVGDGSLGGTALPRSVEQFTELVGRVPLKNLVRETTDIIERLCIEAALEMTKDNRASAAEMLGLSRQGLYAKLRRYGLGDLDDHD